MRIRIALFCTIVLVIWQVTYSVNADTTPDEKQVCLQVLSTARSHVTGEIRVFPNSCIPAGWEMVADNGTVAQPLKKNLTRDEHIKLIHATAALLAQSNLDELLAHANVSRSQVDERFTVLTYLRNAVDDLLALSEKVQEALIIFVTYGVDANSRALGQGERAAVFYSYRDAFQKLPQTEQEFSDMMKIVNGRFPATRNISREKESRAQFKRIYKRIANVHNVNDNAALMIMTYGLQQMAEHRNLSSERRAMNTFTSIYNVLPRTISEWNIMRAITYSGARRKIDTDHDMLSDEDEKQFGTNPSKRDTDGDGYGDGLEVEKGYSPL